MNNTFDFTYTVPHKKYNEILIAPDYTLWYNGEQIPYTTSGAAYVPFELRVSDDINENLIIKKWVQQEYSKAFGSPQRRSDAKKKFYAEYTEKRSHHKKSAPNDDEKCALQVPVEGGKTLEMFKNDKIRTYGRKVQNRGGFFWEEWFKYPQTPLETMLAKHENWSTGAQTEHGPIYIETDGNVIDEDNHYNRDSTKHSEGLNYLSQEDLLKIRASQPKFEPTIKEVASDIDTDFNI